MDVEGQHWPCDSNNLINIFEGTLSNLFENLSTWEKNQIGYTEGKIKIQIKKYFIINIWFAILVLNYIRFKYNS